MAMRNFTADELASYGFTDAEVAMYDGDEPMPGQPGVWLVGIESTDRDYARYAEWLRRRDAKDPETAKYWIDPSISKIIVRENLQEFTPSMFNTSHYGEYRNKDGKIIPAVTGASLKGKWRPSASCSTARTLNRAKCSATK